VRYNAIINRYYQRKRAKSNGVIATKTVAHKVTGNSAAFFRARWVSGQNAVLGNTVSVMG
jgi:hypothetical protein